MHGQAQALNPEQLAEYQLAGLGSGTAPSADEFDTVAAQLIQPLELVLEEGLKV